MIELIGWWCIRVRWERVPAVKGSGEYAKNIGEGVVGHIEHLAKGDDIVVPDAVLAWRVD